MLKNRKLFLTLLCSVVMIIFAANIAMASFVTYVADSLYKAGNYPEALKNYSKLAGDYYQKAAGEEKVNYLFGYETTKKQYIARANDAAKVAVYSFYMQALCYIQLKNYGPAVASLSNALNCFSINKVLIPKSLTSTGAAEVVKIELPANMIADYTAKIYSLPVPVNEVLNLLKAAAEERYAAEKSLAVTPQGPAYNQLMEKIMRLSALEKKYSDFSLSIISRELNARNFNGFETLASFLRNYKPVNKSVLSTLALSDTVIKNITSIAISYQGSDIATATLYNTKMQLLISANAFIKGALAVNGGR